MISLRWNFKVFKLLFRYIHLSLASFSVLLKYKSLNLLTWVCSCQTFQHSSWNIFIFCTKLLRPVLKVHVFWCKTGIYSWNLSEKVSLMYEDSFPIPLLCNFKYINLYFIQNSTRRSCKWLIPPPSKLVMFLKIDPRCFGSFGKFQDTKEISM